MISVLVRLETYWIEWILTVKYSAYGNLGRIRRVIALGYMQTYGIEAQNFCSSVKDKYNENFISLDVKFD